MRLKHSRSRPADKGEVRRGRGRSERAVALWEEGDGWRDRGKDGGKGGGEEEGRA